MARSKRKPSGRAKARPVATPSEPEDLEALTSDEAAAADGQDSAQKPEGDAATGDPDATDAPDRGMPRHRPRTMTAAADPAGRATPPRGPRIRSRRSPRRTRSPLPGTRPGRPARQARAPRTPSTPRTRRAPRAARAPQAIRTPIAARTARAPRAARAARAPVPRPRRARGTRSRSEEHTSELQSRG